jgi:hypothetical protein
VSLAAIALCVASQRVFIVVVVVVVDFIIDSVRKLLDTPSYIFQLFLRRKCNVRCDGYNFAFGRCRVRLSYRRPSFF